MFLGGLLHDQMRWCGRPYDPPSLDLDAPDPCSRGSWRSVTWVSFGRHSGWEVWLTHLYAMRWTAFAQGRLGWPWNDSCGGWSAGEVDPLIQVITTSSIRSNWHFLDQSCSSKLCTRRRAWLRPETWHGAGAAAPVGPDVPGGAAVPSSCGTLVPFPPKYVPFHKNYNTTRGTLLVSKMCMKHVVYSSRTQGFDSRIFLVRTVSKLPQDKCLLILEQSLDLASVD
jgi:hypothetical protein